MVSLMAVTMVATAGTATLYSNFSIRRLEMGCFNVTTNAAGIPYLTSTNVTVSATTVDIALGWRRNGVPSVGYFTVRLENEIPAGTTTTLPVTLSLNGVTKALTLFDGTAVTAAELIGGTGVFLVFYDRFNNILQLMSRTTV